MSYNKVVTFWIVEDSKSLVCNLRITIVKNVNKLKNIFISPDDYYFFKHLNIYTNSKFIISLFFYIIYLGSNKSLRGLALCNFTYILVMCL